MKKYFFLFSIIFAQSSLAQNVDFEKIMYKGLSFSSTKKEITQKLGKPKKIFQPNYECGFLSGETESDIYFTLDYGKIKFTGNSREKFLLEKIDFGNNVILFYGNYKLTNQTTSKQLSKIFGLNFKENGSFLIPSKEGDDGIKIELRKGKLTRMEYWSPC